jgi:hypothetical protein
MGTATVTADDLDALGQVLRELKRRGVIKLALLHGSAARGDLHARPARWGIWVAAGDFPLSSCRRCGVHPV